MPPRPQCDHKWVTQPHSHSGCLPCRNQGENKSHVSTEYRNTQLLDSALSLLSTKCRGRECPHHCHQPPALGASGNPQDQHGDWPRAASKPYPWDEGRVRLCPLCVFLMENGDLKRKVTVTVCNQRAAEESRPLGSMHRTLTLVTTTLWGETPVSAWTQDTSYKSRSCRVNDREEHEPWSPLSPLHAQGLPLLNVESLKYQQMSYK